jgi:hypothetical protein
MNERKNSIIEEIRKLPASNTDEFLKKVVDKLRDFRKNTILGWGYMWWKTGFWCCGFSQENRRLATQG